MAPTLHPCAPCAVSPQTARNGGLGGGIRGVDAILGALARGWTGVASFGRLGVAKLPVVSYPAAQGYPPPAMLSMVYVVDRGANGFVCKSGVRLSPTVPQLTIRIGPNENPHTRALIAGRIYLEEHLESSQVEVTVNHPRSRP